LNCTSNLFFQYPHFVVLLKPSFVFLIEQNDHYFV